MQMHVDEAWPSPVSFTRTQELASWALRRCEAEAIAAGDGDLASTCVAARTQIRSSPAPPPPPQPVLPPSGAAVGHRSKKKNAAPRILVAVVTSSAVQYSRLPALATSWATTAPFPVVVVSDVERRCETFATNCIPTVDCSADRRCVRAKVSDSDTRFFVAD